jgi:hypothetical protein
MFSFEMCFSRVYKHVYMYLLSGDAHSRESQHWGGKVMSVNENYEACTHMVWLCETHPLARLVGITLSVEQLICNQEVTGTNITQRGASKLISTPLLTGAMEMTGLKSLVVMFEG